MLRNVMLSLAHNATVERLARGNRITQQLVERFVAGETLDEAIAVVLDLNARGFSATLDALGENVADRATTNAARDEYLRLLERISQSGARSGISIKLTMLGLDIDVDLCCQHLDVILRTARETGRFVRVDMEGSDYTQQTLHIFYQFREHYPEQVGIVLQSYLYRTDRDVKDAIEQGAFVRLVKGAYAEPETVAYPQKRSVDAAYRRQLELLMDAGRYPAIATHDENIIAVAKGYALRMSIPTDRFEFQMLYGIRRDLQEQLLQEGYRVRVYVPYGTQWYPYFTRRMAERPANLFFVARNVLRR